MTSCGHNIFITDCDTCVLNFLKLDEYDPNFYYKFNPKSIISAPLYLYPQCSNCNRYCGENLIRDLTCAFCKQSILMRSDANDSFDIIRRLESSRF